MWWKSTYLQNKNRLTDAENRRRGVREGWNVSLELADANYYIWDGEITRFYSRTQYRTIL